MPTKLTITRSTLLALAAIALTNCAQAGTITELSDAGDMPGTAQIVRGADELTLIEGTLTAAADADIFAVYIDDPALFSATTAGSTVYDTQLFLFDANGLGVAANDDARNDGTGYDPRGGAGGGSLSAALARGVYFLAVSSWDLDPHSPGGAMFTDDTAYNTVVGPAGPGGAASITGWDGPGGQNGSLGAYQITLTGGWAADHVPEPGTLALAAVGVFGLIAQRQARARR